MTRKIFGSLLAYVPMVWVLSLIFTPWSLPASDRAFQRIFGIPLHAETIAGLIVIVILCMFAGLMIAHWDDSML